MVEFTKKIFKLGNSYAVLIPKALINCKVFAENQTVKIKIEEVPKNANSKKV